MKKIYITLVAVFATILFSYAQSQIITTGNNVVDTSNPIAADVVIGSWANAGTRHDASMMWWSNSSASRISNTSDVFYFSVWNTTTPNIALSAIVGGASYFNGNVGIGTASPEAPLTVYGKSLFFPRRIGAGDARSFQVDYDISNPDFISNDYPIVLKTGGGNQPLILDAARIGIGTSTPDAKLSVNGTIHTKEVKVDLTGWPDYVFKPKYKLPSLTEVKAYIANNHHLPEMPAETEVAKNGINLGEMNKLLVKKVEELTLYLIDKDKQLEDQQRKNEQQDARITALEAVLSKLAINK